MRVEHVERHINEQMIIIDTLSQAYENLVKVGFNNISLQRVTTRLEALREEWGRFHTNNLAIQISIDQLSADDRQSIQTVDYFANALYSSTHDQYLDTLERMTSLLTTRQDTITNASSPVTHSFTSPAPAVHATTRSYQDPRLPRISLPTFSGDYDEWLNFKDLFQSIVVENQLISDTEKHHYLKSCLKGTAAQLFKTASTGEVDFQQAWIAVKNFYDSRRILVSATLDSFFNIKEIKEESAKELERLYTSITQIYMTLKNLKRPVEHWDDILVHIIVRQKLDGNSIRFWEQHIGPSDEPPTWDNLQSFLISRSRTLRAIENAQRKNCSTNVYSKKPIAKIHFTSQYQDKDATTIEHACSLCKEAHYMGKCPKYLQKAPKQRNELVNKLKLCYNCLRPHRVSQCRSVFRCTKCGKRHHSTLHQKELSTVHSKSLSPTPKQVTHTQRFMENPAAKIIILLATALLRVVNCHGETIMVRALLDQGSEITLASENLIQRLKIKRKPSSLPIQGIGLYKSGTTRGVVSIMIKPHFDSTTKINIEAHILPKLTTLNASIHTTNSSWPHLDGLLLADPDFTKPGDIDLILGADIYGYLLDGPIAKGPRNTPIAQQTKLGWVLSGPSQSSTGHDSVSIYHCSVDYDLHALLEKFWRQEEILPSKSHLLSSKDEECENHFVQTHQRDNTGRYTVRLPFKKPIQCIGDSKPSALRMLHHLFRNFKTNLSLFTAYSDFLTEYEQLHHMNRIQQINHNPTFAFYLPHHGVIRESSSTTKLRVVFNGSCKVTDGITLNEALHIGPKCQRDIFDIILWMRTYRYIFSSDIEKMYRQINVHAEDRKHQRILWKKDNQINEYELATVTYGLACAPFLALRTILQLVTDEGSRYPLAVDIMKKGRYVDDIFGGADTIADARLRAQDVFNLCQAGGFPLRKWISNDPDILNFIQPDYKRNTESVAIKDQVVHALGLTWNPSSDVLQFELASSTPSLSTKRSVLSRIGQWFDPLGLLSPLFIKSKILMQELWAIKLNWDEALPAAQQRTWESLLLSLSGLEKIRIPRWLGTLSTCAIEIHGFCDASQLAMAAVVYLRTSDGSKIQTTLVCSKTRVAPLKRVTIPRLELAAAVLLTQLTQRCISVLNLQESLCYLWTDSSIVYTWIKNHPSRWKEFVHNRVCFIQENLPNAQWRHVPGNENPADCATRGLSSPELSEHGLWWNGPSWLSTASSSWPNVVAPVDQHPLEDLEQKPSSQSRVLYLSKENIKWDLLHRYSSLNKLFRVTARCLRAIKMKSFKTLSHPLTPDDVLAAQLFWVNTVQHQYLASEIRRLTDKKDIPKSSSIFKLLPFLDEEGILRVGGRLRNSTLPFVAKHPYILPQQSVLSKLIIEDAHLRTLHGSTQETLSYTRNSYWILGGRRPVRSIILRCVTCTRYRRTHAQHIMGQLPVTRVTPSRPFRHTGVDYAVPVDLKTWKGKSARSYKAWIALFVCFSTSAIHFEIVTDCTSDAFLAAYKRFTSRRGICETLSSDCGTNFKGADRELKKLFNQTSTELQQFASLIALDGTTWSFNPPASPHFGGKWEAGVKSLKYHLRRIVGETRLTYEEFSTVVTQIEAILNSRPLCTLTDDPNDLDVLTPGHFLIGQPLNLLPEPSLLQLQSSRLSRWQHLCQMTQSFWDKWLKEYLQRHQAVYKWATPSPPLKEGALVFIMDERYPPAKWPLGRILKLHYGKDGIARVAELKTSLSVTTRPIVKLCPLNIEPSSESYSSPESTKAAGKC